MARAFIALPLDLAARDAVIGEVERLRPLSRAVAWVVPPAGARAAPTPLVQGARASKTERHEGAFGAQGFRLS